MSCIQSAGLSEKIHKESESTDLWFSFHADNFINDGSVDLSGEICARFVEKYKNILYIEQENRGVSAARNAGLKEAVGKYIFL